MVGHEEETGQREEATVAAAAVGALEEERANLAGPGVVLDEVQRRDLAADGELFGGVLGLAERVGVERLEAADLGHDAARPNHAADAKVLHDEEVLLASRPLRIGRERMSRSQDALPEQSGVWRQGRHAHAGTLGERLEAILIVESGRSDQQHRPPFYDAPSIKASRCTSRCARCRRRTARPRAASESHHRPREPECRRPCGRGSSGSDHPAR